MSLADLGPPAGATEWWVQHLWPLFERHALSVLHEACERLRLDDGRRSSWREDHYSYALHRHLDRICRERNLALSPRFQHPHLSSRAFAMGADPKAAVKIDLVLLWHNAHPEIGLAIEAKVLVSAPLGGYDPAKTVRDYVDQGMQRFVDGRYAPGLPSGAMLGYVLVGPASVLVERVNRRLRETGFPCAQPITATTSDVPDHYESRHGREQSPAIRLHHLFVAF